MANTDPDESLPKKQILCYYHTDRRHEIDKCQSLKFMVEKLIKAEHLGRYIREIDHGVESRQATNKVTAAKVVPPESRQVYTGQTV